jgi:hypothetical protein
MLKITDVEYGLVPFGGSAGIRALGIYVKDDDQPFDFKSFDIDPESDPDPWFSYTVKLFNELKVRYPDAMSHWENVLLAKEQCFFIGNGWEYEKNRDFTSAFFDKYLDKAALELQIKTFKVDKKTGKNLNQLHAPWVMFVGRPLVNTGSFQCYERFSQVYAVCDLSDGEGKLLNKKTSNYADYFTPFALLEMLRHTFGMVVFRIKNMDELDVINDVYVKSVVDDFIPNKTLIIPYYPSEKIIEAILDYTKEHPYRFYLDLNNHIPQRYALDFYV